MDERKTAADPLCLSLDTAGKCKIPYQLRKKFTPKFYEESTLMSIISLYNNVALL